MERGCVPQTSTAAALGSHRHFALAAFQELLAPRVEIYKDGTMGSIFMEVNWMLIHTPEAESLCFFRHTERKCCLPSVMTHCPFVDVYLLLFKNRRQKTESRPTTTETSKTIHTRKKEVWEVNCIAQCRGVWQPWALFSSLGPGKKSPHLNTRVLPGLPGQPLSPMSSSPTTASHPPHRD